MHRRNRHFKGGSINCNLQLDARYLTQSDGTALSSWSDRSSNSYTASQATGINQPLVKTGANGINGNPVVLFDGSNDFMTISSFVINSDMYAIFVVKLISTQMLFEHSVNANSGTAFYIYGQSNRNWSIVRNVGTYYIVGTNNWVGTSNALATIRYSDASGGNYYLNGSVISKSGEFDSLTSATNATNTLYIMSRAGTQLFTNGNLGAVIMGSGDLSEPLRKRIQVALAYSFKIACS